MACNSSRIGCHGRLSVAAIRSPANREITAWLFLGLVFVYYSTCLCTWAHAYSVYLCILLCFSGENTASFCLFCIHLYKIACGFWCLRGWL